MLAGSARTACARAASVSASVRSCRIRPHPINSLAGPSTDGSRTLHGNAFLRCHWRMSLEEPTSEPTPQETPQQRRRTRHRAGLYIYGCSCSRLSSSCLLRSPCKHPPGRSELGFRDKRGPARLAHYLLGHPWLAGGHCHRHCHPPQHPPSLTHRLVDVHEHDNARSRETLASIPFDDDHATVEAAYRALPSDSP